MRELARCWFPRTKSIPQGQAGGNRAGQGGPESC